MSEIINSEFNFRGYAWKQFKTHKPAYISLYILGFLAIVALLAPALANERPLYMKYKGENYFPAFSFKNKYEIIDAQGKKESIQLDIADWKRMRFDKVIWAPIAYSPGKSDLANAYFKSPEGEQFYKDSDGKLIKAPKQFRHILGTNQNGEDLAAGLIYGARISLTIGFLSMTIASIIGLLLGSVAGYFGDEHLYTSRGRFWFTILGIVAAWFYAFQTRKFILSDAIAKSAMQFLIQLLISIFIFAAVIYLFAFTGKYIGKIKGLNKKVNIAADSIISRLIEIINSLPTFILILSVAAIAKPSFINLMVIIGLTSWTGIARFTRAEFLRIRNLEYIQAAHALGYSEKKIIFRHALPNGLAPALISIAFGIASAILIESSLSFLGVGVPAGTVTWGSLVNEGRSNFNAWWLVLFPGMAIFITVTVYNLIGEGLRDALDPKLKT